MKRCVIREKSNPWVAGLCIVAMMIASDIHLAALQMTGWLGMTVEYSLESEGIGEGISRTFSGDEPCSLCSFVEEVADSAEPVDQIGQTDLEFRLVGLQQSETLSMDPPSSIKSVDLGAFPAPLALFYRPPYPS